MAQERQDIRGNWLVLAGSLLYLLEWVAIFPAGDSGPAEAGLKSDKVLALYTAHPTAVMFLAGWLGVVLVGRVLIILGIRAALRSAGEEDALVLFAAAAMALSIAIEVISETAVAVATVLTARSGDADLIRAFDTFGGIAFATVFGPLGLAVAVTSWVMLRSRAFPMWICVLGLVGGSLGILSGVTAGPAYLHDGTARSLSSAAQVGAPLFWLWMLATGIFLVRRIRRPAPG